MTTSPIDLDTLRLASGIWGDDPEARELVRARLLVVLEQQEPSLTMLTDASAEGMPYAVLALHALDDIPGAVGLLGYHWHDERLLADARVRAWAAEVEPAQLRPLAGRRHPWDSESLPDLLLERWSDLGAWAGILAGPYIRSGILPRTWRWDNSAHCLVRLQAILTETQHAGYHLLTERWYRATDLERGPDGRLQAKPSAVLLVTYEKRYTDGLIGPVSRTDTVYLHRVEGEPLTWTLDAKVYDAADSRRLAVQRRQYAMQELQGMVSAGVGDRATGQAMLALFESPVRDFVNTGDAPAFLASLAAGAAALPPASGGLLAAMEPVITARLAPWL